MEITLIQDPGNMALEAACKIRGRYTPKYKDRMNLTRYPPDDR